MHVQLLCCGVAICYMLLTVVTSRMTPTPPPPPEKITDVRLAEEWLIEANQKFMDVLYRTVTASWDYATNMTDETQRQQLVAQEKEAVFVREIHKNGSRFAWQKFPKPLKRQFEKIVDLGTAILPDVKLKKLNQLAAELSRMYSTTKVCNKPGDNSGRCYPLDPDMSEILAKSRDWDELKWAWDSWRRDSGPQMAPLYTEFVQLQNEAAKLNGYSDMGARWRARYETPDIQRQLASLWQQVRPMYEQLHAYAGRRLRAHYGSRNFPPSGHIPAHLLGNMWGQQWNNIQDLLMPFPNKTSIDVTPEMIKQGYNTTRLFIVSEEFFTSLGLLPMPAEFWKESMILKPRDGRAVVCHASAWDFYNQKDFRIKQCTEVTQEWLFTTHHEMGHIQYFIQYKDQPVWFREGANSGFHEAIGDVMELSVNTPIHLNKIGLLPTLENDPEVDINYLMSMALKKVAFLPFGYLIDQWRWQVFSGEAQPKDYNSAWWKLRCQYQGLSPPTKRPDGAFDAGSKFHVPNNTPYIRYFVSFIVQFQFHKALCDASGYKGPLHKCDIYQSKEAGKLIGDMMKLGSSLEWPEAMMKIAGSRDMDAQPLLDFFEPVLKWLQKENAGHKVGWDDQCPDVTNTDQESEARKWLVTYNSWAQEYHYNSVSAAWNYNTNLTLHNQNISLQAVAKSYAFEKEAALNASSIFNWKNFSDPKLKREFSKVTELRAAVLPTEKLNRLNKLRANMGRIYSKAKLCNKPGDVLEKCYSMDPDLTNIMASSRDWDELLWAWQGWRNVTGTKMADDYEEFVSLLNEAAVKNGHTSHSEALKFDYQEDGRTMDPLYEFEADIERLWRQVRPLYEQLHAYTRRKLQQRYPHHVFPQTGHIPAHLLGNMWAQSWNNLESLLRPFPNKTGVDVTNEMRKQNYDAIKIFKLSEEFFTSLGLIAMPPEFWNQSMMTKPKDRDVVCHASAWDFYNQKEFRIKQCTDITMAWLVTTHHEMGHIQYYLQYKDQPVNFRRGGNSGFHEAIGDVMALSVATPEHLEKIGLLPNYTPDPDIDLNFLMRQSLKKIAFLPFGYLIDQWRWDVFSGKTRREEYNSRWWDARCRFQGISPPVTRGPSRDFDPGAKYHVPYNTPYIRYFISHILQFQFQKALCNAAGHTGPLYKCDIYRSKTAGKLIGDMMKLGSSTPWPDALEAITGNRVMSAEPLMEYFRPLQEWLERENKGHPIGWNEYCFSGWMTPQDNSMSIPRSD